MKQIIHNLFLLLFYHAQQREKTSQAFRDATVGIYKSSRIFKLNKGTDEKKTTTAKYDDGSSTSSVQSNKRAYPHIFNNDANLIDEKKQWQNQVDEESNISQHMHQRHKSVLDGDAFYRKKTRVISPSNRMMKDSFTEDVKEKKRLSMDTFFRSENSLGTDRSSCDSLTSLNILLNLEHKEDTVSSQSYFNNPLVPHMIETVMNPEMILLNPSKSPMLATNNSVTDIVASNNSATVTLATNNSVTDIVAANNSVTKKAAFSTAFVKSDAKTDEETFDRLLQLYESWK